jgi:hypothetical protein
MDEISPEEVRKQVAIKVCAFIFCDNASPEELNKTLNSLKKQIIVPNIVYCVFQENQSIPGIFQNNYEDFKLLHSNFNMKINYEHVEIYDAMDEILERTESKSTHLLMINPGQVIPTNFIQNADTVINEDMEPMHVFESPNTSVKIVSYSSLLMYGYEDILENNIPGLEDFTCLI